MPFRRHYSSCGLLLLLITIFVLNKEIVKPAHQDQTLTGTWFGEEGSLVKNN